MAKVSRKELLKKQDEFLTFTEKAGKWVRHNRRRLFTGVGVAVVVVVVALGILTYNRYQQKQAAQAYGQAFYMYQLAQANVSPGSLATLIQTYSRISEDFTDSKAGQQARQCLGALYMQSGELNRAEEILTQLTRESGVEKDLLAVTWGTLAQCREMAGKNNEAIEAYAKAASLSGPNSANIWQSARARLLMAQDRPAAQALYEQVWNTSSNRFLRFIAARMLVNMGVKPSLGAAG